MEWDAVWESGEKHTFSASQAIPSAPIRPGRSYRARVRHQDDSGRWSQWSEALQFVASEPDTSPFEESIVISEIMYHPAEATPAELVGFDDESFEFIELTTSAIPTSISPDYDSPKVSILMSWEALSSISPPAHTRWSSTTWPPSSRATERHIPLLGSGKQVTASPIAGSDSNYHTGQAFQFVTLFTSTIPHGLHLLTAMVFPSP